MSASLMMTKKISPTRTGRRDSLSQQSLVSAKSKSNGFQMKKSPPSLGGDEVMIDQLAVK